MTALRRSEYIQEPFTSELRHRRTHGRVSRSHFEDVRRGSRILRIRHKGLNGSRFQAVCALRWALDALIGTRFRFWVVWPGLRTRLPTEPRPSGSDKADRSLTLAARTKPSALRRRPFRVS